MYLDCLQVNHYRNYDAATVHFGSGVNLLTGDNAQGKTNLIEAIYLAGVGKSRRTPRDRELIQWGEERARIRTRVVKRAGAETVDIVLDKRENKRIAINGLPVTRVGELMGVSATVMFSPDEISVVKDGPSDRRRFMDVTLCQLSKTYFYLLARYNKILAQRNRLLKSGAVSGDGLDVWNEQLATEGARIIRTRRGYVERLGRVAAVCHSLMTDGKESMVLTYDGIAGADVAEIKAAFLDELKRTRDKDLMQGFTHAGAQTDDLVIEIDGVDVRRFGSQGQQRTAALSLKLAELDLMREEIGEYPILLLDDVFSELDLSRQIKLAQKAADYQTIITCTHIPGALTDCFRSARVFRVSAGSVAPV